MTRAPSLAEAIAPPAALATRHAADALGDLVDVEIAGTAFRSYALVGFGIEIDPEAETVSVRLAAEVFFSPVEGELETVYPCGATIACPVGEFLKSTTETWETFALLLVERAWPGVFSTWAQEADFHGFGFDGMAEIEYFSRQAAGNKWRLEA